MQEAPTACTVLQRLHRTAVTLARSISSEHGAAAPACSIAALWHFLHGKNCPQHPAWTEKKQPKEGGRGRKREMKRGKEREGEGRCTRGNNVSLVAIFQVWIVSSIALIEPSRPAYIQRGQSSRRPFTIQRGPSSRRPLTIQRVVGDPSPLEVLEKSATTSFSFHSHPFQYTCTPATYLDASRMRLGCSNALIALSKTKRNWRDSTHLNSCIHVKLELARIRFRLSLIRQPEKGDCTCTWQPRV